MAAEDELSSLMASLGGLGSGSIFGKAHIAQAEAAGAAAAQAAGEAAAAHGAEPAAAQNAARQAGRAAALAVMKSPAQKSKKSRKTRRVTFNAEAEAKATKALKDLEKALAADARRRRAQIRSGVPYAGRLSKRVLTRRNRLYQSAMARMMKPKTSRPSLRRTARVRSALSAAGEGLAAAAGAGAGAAAGAAAGAGAGAGANANANAAGAGANAAGANANANAANANANANVGLMLGGRQRRSRRS